MRKFIIMVILCLFLLSACSKSPEIEEIVEEEQITLRFSWWGTGARHENTLAAIEEYERLNPNIDIVEEYSSYDGYYQKTITQLVGGTAADIIQIDQPWIYQFENNSELFADLSLYSDYINLSTFDSEFIDDYCQVDGKIVGLPTGINGMIFRFNTVYENAMGVSLGASYTWEDLIEYGKLFREIYGENAYLLGQNSESFQVFILRPYLIQLSGNDFITEDYELGFNEEQLNEAFDFIVRLLDENIAIHIYTDLPESSGVITAGCLTWTSSLLNDSNDDEITILDFPIMENNAVSGTIIRPSQLFSINKSSEYPEESAKFIEFLLNSSEGVSILGLTRGMPVSGEAVNTLNENDAVSSTIQIATDFVLEHNATSSNAINSDTTVDEMVQKVVNKVVFKEISTEEATIELMSNLNTYLKNFK